jgi:hypothetical protein
MKMREVWDSFAAILQKGFVHIRRDRGTLVIALFIPVFQLVLFGFIDQTVSDLPTVIVDQDGTRFARELMDKLRATQTFKITHVTADPRAARDDVTAGRNAGPLELWPNVAALVAISVLMVAVSVRNFRKITV